MTVAVLGIDLAKRVFHLHGIDARGRPVVSKRVTIRASASSSPT